MEKFSDRLKELRLERGLTQVELANALNNYISHQAIDFWERGVRDIKLSNAIKLAKFFNVSLDYLAGLSDEYKKY